MTFSAIETSRAQAAPVHLYFFCYGSQPNAFYAYTDAEDQIIHDNITYQPIPIERGNISASGDLDKSDMDIRVPIDVGLAQLFTVYPPGQPVQTIIRQGHLSDVDADFLVVYVGRIIQCERNASTATVKVEPFSTSMRRPGLRRHYQLTCPHMLYGVACQASQATRTRVAVVSVVEGARLTLLDGWNDDIASNKYLGGIIEWQTGAGLERRTILRIADTKILSLSGPTTGVTTGMNVNVSAGCNRQMDDCRDLHNNIHNFGGQPFIPLENPINKNPFN